MLSVSELELRTCTLNFSSSAQGRVDVRAAVFDSTILANALELLDADSAAVQLIVCEDCGVTGCWPGGWVCFRRFGADVLQIPAFAKMEEAGLEEAGPPAYMEEHAIVRYTKPAYQRLVVTGSSLPAAEDLQPLTAFEAARALQWEAPLAVLGRFPDRPDPDFGAIIACADGDVEGERRRLRSLLHSFFSTTSAVKREQGDRMRTSF